MKLLNLVSAIASLSLVAAHPTGKSSLGAVYLLTNLDENAVITGSIGADGTVSFAHAFDTHGKGSTGTKATPGADPLFSQDAVKVSGNKLYAVNAGSNTVTAFTINPNDPTQIKMIGAPVDSCGDFPVSVAVSENKDMICVLNGGTSNGVSCYKSDPQHGLVPINDGVRSLNLNQTTPPSGPPNTVSDIIFNDDSSKLLASVKGTPPNSSGFIAAWDIAEGGSLSDNFEPSTPATGGLLPFSMTPVKGKNALVVADPAIGFSVYDLTNLNVENGTPATSTIIPITGQKANCWSNFSKKTGNYYLTDAGASIVTEVSVSDDLTGAVVKQYPLAANSSCIDNAVASLPNKDFFYALSAGKNAIDVFSLDGPGNANHIQTFDLSSPLQQVGITVDPTRLQGMAVYTKN